MSFDRSYQVPFLLHAFLIEILPCDRGATTRTRRSALFRWLYGRPRTARGDAPTFLTAFHDSAGCAQEKVVKPRLAPGSPMELS